MLIQHRQQRNYWLDYYGQEPAGYRRRQNGFIDPALDAVPLPPPFGPLPRELPWGVPCLAWKRQLNDFGDPISGPAKIDRDLYAQSREESVPYGRIVKRVCRRPWCIQPGHIYAGLELTPRDPDRTAAFIDWNSYDLETAACQSWQAPAQLPHDFTLRLENLTAPLTCPHSGRNGLCRNCGYDQWTGATPDYAALTAEYGLWPGRQNRELYEPPKPRPLPSKIPEKPVDISFPGLRNAPPRSSGKSGQAARLARYHGQNPLF